MFFKLQKLVRTHNKPWPIRLPSRLPVCKSLFICISRNDYLVRFAQSRGISSENHWCNRACGVSLNIGVTSSSVPAALFILFLAVAFPFYTVINGFLGAFTTSFGKLRHQQAWLPCDNWHCFCCTDLLWGLWVSHQFDWIIIIFLVYAETFLIVSPPL